MSECIGCLKELDISKQEYYAFPAGALCVPCGDNYGTKRHPPMSQKDATNCDNNSDNNGDNNGPFKCHTITCNNRVDKAPGWCQSCIRKENIQYWYKNNEGAIVTVPSFDPLDWSPYPESGLGYNLNPDSLNKAMPSATSGAITLFPPGYGSCLHCPHPPQHNHALCKDCEEAINNKLNDVIPKPSPWAVCECGAEKANEGRATTGHSSWCPKFQS